MSARRNNGFTIDVKTSICFDFFQKQLHLFISIVIFLPDV